MKCYLHNFETDDIEKWDKHCYYNGHTNIVWENGEKIVEPYPRHFMRDMNAGMRFGPFSKNNPPSPELLKALENDDIEELTRLKKQEDEV